ncbi:hypothetical protein KPL47_00880 [Clostridium estertheticum]|uniref:hypothetical protein n=1 Tax=Clostridium estertheticum TaxID=238834 RepID=UPI001C0D6810|nr:hypothetical protein [Clostridium estertheticum]MBU3174916.1 hypothetical protein [Clostridium estertheticum]
MNFFSMLMVILATVTYHICQKSINTSVNPAVSLIGSYGIAIITSTFAFIIMPHDHGLIESFKQLNPASYILGFSAFTLELGYFYVYRSGWNIAVAPIFANIITAVILILIGILIYKTKITLTNIMGIMLSIMGLILINKK